LTTDRPKSPPSGVATTDIEILVNRIIGGTPANPVYAPNCPERIDGLQLAELLSDGSAVGISDLLWLDPIDYNPSLTYARYSVARLAGTYYYALVAVPANTPPPSVTNWRAFLRDGNSAIALTTGTNPNTPAVGASATYGVDSTAGILLQQHYGLTGVSGTFICTTKTPTSVTLQNVDAAAGSAIVAGTVLTVVGRRGAVGAQGSQGATGAQGLTGAQGNPGPIGPSALALTTGTNPNTPAVGASATYNVDSTAGILLQQHYGLAGVSGTFICTIKTATSVTLQNVDAAVGSAVAAGAAIAPVGRRGEPGLGSALTIRESDNSPSGLFSVLEVPAGALVDQGGGVARIDFPSSAGGGLSKQIISSSGTLGADTLNLIESATPVTLSTPPTAPKLSVVRVVRAAAGIPSIVGGTYQDPLGNSNSGVRFLSSHTRGTLELTALNASNTWIVTHPIDMAGIELFAVATDPLAGFFTSFWRLDESSGTRQDAISSNHLTPVNDPGFNTDGLIGGSAEFFYDPEELFSQHPTLEIVSNASLSAGIDTPICVTVAVRFHALALELGGTYVLASKDESSSVGEWYLYYNGNSFVFSVFNGSTPATASYFELVDDTTWYIVTAWFDPVGNNVNVQVNNGTPISSSVAANFSIPATAANLRLGTYTSERELGFIGQIDCFGFAKAVPTAAQRTAIFNGGLGYSPL
jgi:hypothetical protein